MGACKLEQNEELVFYRPFNIPPTIISNGDVRFVYSEPDSHYYTDLNQIIESLKYFKNNYEHLIIGVQNTMKQGREILNENGKGGIYVLGKLEYDLNLKKSAVHLTKILKFLLEKGYNIREQL